jgi:hypothetical protein
MFASYVGVYLIGAFSQAPDLTSKHQTVLKQPVMNKSENYICKNVFNIGSSLHEQDVLVY